MGMIVVLAKWFFKVFIVPIVVLAHVLYWVDYFIFILATNFPAGYALKALLKRHISKSLAWMILQIIIIMLLAWVIFLILNSA